jgi:predicted CoA-substrate-specific enzyme activase
MFIAGIDLGARSTKAVVIDENRRVLGWAMVRTRPDFEAVARLALNESLRSLGIEIEDLDYVATTGFGRYNVPFRDVQITDMTSAARGSVALFPGTRCVLDIGAQSTRAIKVDEHGRVRDFKTNDKCAAGAGGFIERSARYLEVALEEVGTLSLKADDPQPISSICAVLAESEIVNHVSNGRSVENILRGIHQSLASRALGLLKRVGIEPEVTFVGGVARQAGMVAALEDALGMKVNVPESPDLVNALGAAVLGLRRWQKLEGGAIAIETTRRAG